MCQRTGSYKIISCGVSNNTSEQNQLRMLVGKALYGRNGENDHIKPDYLYAGII